MQFQISYRRENGLKHIKVIKIRVLRKVFSKQFCFIKCRKQQLRALLWSKWSRFAFAENTISNSPKVLRAKFLGSDGLFCFVSICKFGSFKSLFATITNLSTLFYIQKIYSACTSKRSHFYELLAAAHAAENHGDE